MISSDDSVTALFFPNGTALTFNADTLTLTMTVTHEAGKQEIHARLTDGAAKTLGIALTEGVETMESLRRERSRRVEEEILKARAEQHKAFSVFTKAAAGPGVLVQATEYIHRRTCSMAPPAAREASAQAVKELVSRYAGDMMHQLDFCRNCFPTHEGMGPDIFSAPVTNSGELRAVLDKLEAEHVRAARIARGEHGVDVELDLQDDTGIERLMGSDLNPAERAAVDGQLDDSVTLPV